MAGGGRPYATLSVETVGRSTQVAVARPLSVLWKINDDGFSPTPSVDGACRRNEKLYYREPCRSRVCLHAVGSSKTEDRLCYAVFTLCCRLYNRLVNYANEPSQAALERSSQDAYD